MSNQQEIQRETWERLVDFLYPPGEMMETEEINACVLEFGDEIDAGFAKFESLIEHRRRQVRLEQASQQRESLQQRLKSVVSPKVENLKDRVRSLVQKSGDEERRLAYFHKLENAESEADLHSLLEDLEKLDAISGFDDEA